MTNPLQPTEIEIAKRLRDSGLSWANLAAGLDTTQHQIRMAIDPEYVRRQKTHSKARFEQRQHSQQPAPERVLPDDRMIWRTRSGENVVMPRLSWHGQEGSL